MTAIAVRCAAGVAAAAAIVIGAALPATAQSYADFVQQANQNTVTIVSGAPGETSLGIAHDLSTVLHCVDGLRIIPITGRGDANNVYDLLFLRGVDMAIVRADVLDHLDQSETFIADLKDRVRFVAPLFEQEVHLLAGDAIETINDLEGKIVNIGAAGTLGLAARRVLSAAGVTVIETKLDNALALERVIDGGIDAMFITGGKPIPLLEGMGMVSGLRFVPTPLPPDLPVYNMTTLTHDDYPGLVPAGEEVSTISVPSVLAVYNWPSDNERFEKNALFTRAFFRRSEYLRRPARHPKWGDARLEAAVPGWTRFAPAQELVDRIVAERGPVEVAAVSAEPSGPTPEQLELMFEQQLREFGIEPRTPLEREQLFLAFKRRMEATQ